MSGMSERRNRTLLDMVQSMMCRSTLPGHALETAAHILNKVPTKSVEKTPYDIWTGKKPKLSFLKIWGCEVYVKRYPKNTLGYYFYSPSENKVFVARNGEFLEEKFLNLENNRNDVDLQIVEEDTALPIIEPVSQQENVETQPETVEEVQTQDLRRSTRVRQEPDRYLGFLVSHDGEDLNEPTSYEEAVSGSCWGTVGTNGAQRITKTIPKPGPILNHNRYKQVGLSVYLLRLNFRKAGRGYTATDTTREVARPPLLIGKISDQCVQRCDLLVSYNIGHGSFACATAPELSQNISIGLEILATTLRSDRKFLSQTASFAASHAAMYSASVVESAIVSCFELFHEIAPPFRVKTYPDCDLKSSLSVWKLASEYPVTLISSSEPPKTKNISFVLLRYLRMFLTATQWGSPGFCWYLLATLTE
ncbi:hypothetical protein OSB04_006852 [Centaurea solstitialis]|uniref:Uncharacterized protein n=1 Tax=Centaurea solstitialis TaxID=347529 RepID=A0AA38WI22_9ASTR|nr:hypothetical protein OSB04_006852 [Centaurea solstitialis]